jgi:hypothetical protein
MTCPDPHEADAAPELPDDTHGGQAGPQPAGRPWLRRIAAPSYLLLALLMFPLPWVQIQCIKQAAPSTPPAVDRIKPLEMISRLLPRWDARTLLSQSGLQAACGTCWVNPEVNDPAEVERQWVAAMRASFLMALWPAVMLGGVVAGLLLPTGRRRRWAVGGCAAAALLLVFAQVLAGFPVEDAWRKLDPEGYEKQAAGTADLKEGAICRTYTYWFLLAVLSTGWALVLTGLEWRRDRRRRRAEGLPAPPACEPDSPVRSP